MVELLKDYAITHGGIQPVNHPRLGVEVHGQTAIRYLRFLRPVQIDRLELSRLVYGRWVPAVPCHPAHLRISQLDQTTHRWEIVREVDLPADPRIAGEGLSQGMTIAEMEAHFAAILRDPPHVIELGGLQTDHLRVECDREHPVWPNHGECNGSPFGVPFGILNGLQAYGMPLGASPEFRYNPPLTVTDIHPTAPRGMMVEHTPTMLRFTGECLSVGFSLRRPVLMHLGWDIRGEGQAQHNRLRVNNGNFNAFGGLSGPLLRDFTQDFGPHLWTGAVAVQGNTIAYRSLHCVDGLTLDATFTVEPDRLLIELTQHAEREMPVIEQEAWRLTYDLTQGITGTAAMSTLLPGRNGDVYLPAMWASDGVGCLSCQPLEGAPRLQVESYRNANCVTGGLVLGAAPSPDACQVIPAGTQRAVVELAVDNLVPTGQPDDADCAGVARHWATTFSCFRPEHRGFSNNAASVNCHLSQGPPIEIAALTRKPAHGPNPLDLGRFTIERALLDGGGYGYWRNLYLDSDPVLVSAAGRLHQADPNLAWLRRIEPGLREVVERLLGNIGEEGLVVCRDLSGDAGSYRWSCNGMDVVGFGHLDAYVNACSYRAFRNAAVLLGELGQHNLSQRSRDAADTLRDNYAACLLNPETGWVAGWRSRDGAYHDAAFTWVNGIAIAFGLLAPSVAKSALEKLENLREKVGMGSACLGLPLNLLPIQPEDHILPQILGLPQPTFEFYTDGSLCTQAATYYLRALSIYGFTDSAKKMAAELDEGFAGGYINGGIGTGHEFRSWEGFPTGYEGTLIGCFGPLYALAIEQGLLTPPEPEWWPADR
ncbi:MAG: glucosidase family protein [Armatimonadota bacterium]